jgi:hypothetical protein
VVKGYKRRGVERGSKMEGSFDRESILGIIK